MVVEMTSLQGIMGASTRWRSASQPEVAQAIFEHYLPRSGRRCCRKPGLGRGRWPTGWIRWRACSLPGWQPAGTTDPFALRRGGHGPRADA